VRKVCSIAIIATLFLVSAAPLLSKPRKEEPKQVGVIHILIGFKKTVSGKVLDRTKKQAQDLAYEILDRAEAGEEFDTLLVEYSDDYKAQRGIVLLKMNNFGEPITTGVFGRSTMAASFAEVSFQLEVGEIGFTRYHPGNSPFGYHIIKRIE